MRFCESAALFVFLGLLRPARVLPSVLHEDRETLMDEPDQTGSGDWTEEAWNSDDNSPLEESSNVPEAKPQDSNTVKESAVSNIYSSVRNKELRLNVAKTKSFLANKDILAGIIAGAVTGATLGVFLSAILIYRRKKSNDEVSQRQKQTSEQMYHKPIRKEVIV